MIFNWKKNKDASSEARTPEEIEGSAHGEGRGGKAPELTPDEYARIENPDDIADPDMRVEVKVSTSSEELPDGENEEQTIVSAEPEPGVLRTENLVKKYGRRTVANNVSINVRQGEIVGLLGPNGAG